MATKRRPTTKASKQRPRTTPAAERGTPLDAQRTTARASLSEAALSLRILAQASGDKIDAVAADIANCLDFAVAAHDIDSLAELHVRARRYFRARALFMCRDCFAIFGNEKTCPRPRSQGVVDGVERFAPCGSSNIELCSQDQAHLRTRLLPTENGAGIATFGIAPQFDRIVERVLEVIHVATSSDCTSFVNEPEAALLASFFVADTIGIDSLRCVLTTRGAQRSLLTKVEARITVRLRAIDSALSEWFEGKPVDFACVAKTFVADVLEDEMRRSKWSTDRVREAMRFIDVRASRAKSEASTVDAQAIVSCESRKSVIFRV